MELIRILKERSRANCSMRKMLRRYGINDDAEITQPLAEMQPGKAMRIAVNWLTVNAKNGYEIELLMPVPEEQMVYVIGLSSRCRSIYVRYVHAAPGLIGKMLHQRDLQVNYQTLTLEEIQSSVYCAEAANL